MTRDTSATFTFFVANQLLPLGTKLAGSLRAGSEIGALRLVWLATFVHPWPRPVECITDFAFNGGEIGGARSSK